MKQHDIDSYEVRAHPGCFEEASCMVCGKTFARHVGRTGRAVVKTCGKGDCTKKYNNPSWKARNIPGEMERIRSIKRKWARRRRQKEMDT